MVYDIATLKVTGLNLKIDPVVSSTVDTETKLNVYKTFRRRPGCFRNVLCTFNLRPMSAGLHLKQQYYLNFFTRFPHGAESIFRIAPVIFPVLALSKL